MNPDLSKELAMPLPKGYIVYTDETEQIMRQVIIYPGEDGQFVAECPSLPGCISQGRTREEAIINVREAIQGYIASLEQDNLPVPPERFDTLLVAV
jgi:predicted RNase H-like HicB family nuclease